MPGILGFNFFVTSTGLVGIKSKSLSASLKPETPNIKAKINETGPLLIYSGPTAPTKMVAKTFRRV